MYLLLSGEGPTDIGYCNMALRQCKGSEFLPGPMAVMVDKLVEQAQGYELSHIDSGLVEFVSEKYLVDGAADLKALRKSPSLPGVKKKKETLYFRRNARVLAKRALEKSDETDGEVIAVLFRDSDDLASAGRGEWQDKWDSMIKGFEDEGYAHGIPMIPKPKSEAWLLCALANNYQHCTALENESGNDDGAHPLKDQLTAVVDNDSAQAMTQSVRDGEVDVQRIDMPSFNQFKDHLRQVVSLVTGVPLS